MPNKYVVLLFFMFFSHLTFGQVAEKQSFLRTGANPFIQVTVVDKGALDCTLKARVECAVYRSNDVVENLPWGGAIK